MSRKLSPEDDKPVRMIVDVLGKYKVLHPKARIDAYRRYAHSIRIRIIDPDFSGINRADRHNAVWRFLKEMPDDVVGQISLLVLVTPKESKVSGTNLEFENPTRYEDDGFIDEPRKAAAR